MPADTSFNFLCYMARYPDLSNNGWMYKSADGSWKYGNPSNRETKNLNNPTNAFWHWQNFGLAEGRVCGCDLPGTIYSAEFNPTAYLNRYPDVRGTAILNSQWASNPEGHYRTIGIGQGRHPGYEILTSTSPQGMVSPGTTTVVQDQPDLSPGSGDIVLNPVDTLPTDTTLTNTTTANTNDLSTWVAANPLLVAGGAALLLIILSKHKKKKRA